MYVLFFHNFNLEMIYDIKLISKDDKSFKATN